jgi:hypothetical protein
MSLETWFWIAHAPALAGWLALLLVRNEKGVWFARYAAVALAVGYAIIFFSSAPETSVLARDYGMRGVAAFFARPELLLLGWIHYLAFDLFVGSWMVEEGRRIGVPPRVMVPVLILTAMLGPLGLLAFFAARSVPRYDPPRDGEGVAAFDCPRQSKIVSGGHDLAAPQPQAGGGGSVRASEPPPPR